MNGVISLAWRWWFQNTPIPSFPFVFSIQVLSRIIHFSITGIREGWGDTFVAPEEQTLARGVVRGNASYDGHFFHL